ncbi:hypothetical protein Godav_012712 [Gossypium davidsonii]|uniref:Uncharacterized protein n=1 Tax=Gossypium davidsonii TaxID=34287 RepID=A0A7J8RE08_GOSDV|nr:hypothetical protein [Gossypium davidsonii]
MLSISATRLKDQLNLEGKDRVFGTSLFENFQKK